MRLALVSWFVCPFSCNEALMRLALVCQLVCVGWVCVGRGAVYSRQGSGIQ